MKNLINKILLIDNKADLDEVINAVKIARSNINRTAVENATAYLVSEILFLLYAVNAVS